MWGRKRGSVSFTPRKLRKPSLLLKRRTPTTNKPSSNIKVIVRVRPQNEKDSTCRQIIQVVDDQCLIFDPKEEEEEFYAGGRKQLNRDMSKKRNRNIEFQFDRVFDEGATNWDVFEGTTQNLIDSLVDGYNCSVFVYGATGSGKTYTMLGSKETPGIAYLTMLELYKQMQKVEMESKFDLKISYLEVYNETVTDLISPSGPLNLRDDGKDGIIISGIKTHRIETADELYQMLERGNKNRTQHPTDANAESSRSHAVFQVHINITEKISMETKYSKLTMIDLAGSERGGVTGGKGARFSEGSNINKSLLALGNCVDALAGGQKHIPYRSSKLTRLLKDSLGGNCRTVMIVNVAPTNYAYVETFNTLNYANRAKKINNKIRRNLCNVDLAACQYRKIIEELKQRNLDLEQENRMLKEDGSLPQNKCSNLSVVSEETASSSDIENGREVLRCLYELEGKYRKDILIYQMKIKTLDWRIYQKKVIAERFHMFEYLVGDLKIQTKMDETARKLKLQQDTFKEKVRGLQKSLKVKQAQREMALKEIEEKGLQKILQGDIDYYSHKMSQECYSLQVSYYKDLLLKQQNEMSSCDKIINLLCKNMDYYYSVLSGIGRISDPMKEEYLQLVLQLAGVKGVSWQDETCDYNILRKIIDLSYTSIDTNESPATVSCSGDGYSEPSNKCLPTVSPIQVPVIGHMKEKIATLSVIDESLNDCPSPMPNLNPISPFVATPSVGLQCIAEYLTPVDDLSVPIAENTLLVEKCQMPACPETPLSISEDKSLNVTYVPISPVSVENFRVEVNTTVPYPPDNGSLKLDFNKTFSVHEFSHNKSNLSFDKSFLQELGSSFVTLSPQGENCKEDKFVGINLKDSIPLNTTFVSDSSQTENKCDTLEDAYHSLSEKKDFSVPILDSICYSMPLLGACEEVVDGVGVSQNNSNPALNTTFNSDGSLEERLQGPFGNNASRSSKTESKLNTTFTSSSPIVLDECPVGNVSSIPSSNCENVGSASSTPTIDNIHESAEVVSATKISAIPKVSKVPCCTISPARKIVTSSNSKFIQSTKSTKNELVPPFYTSYGSNYKSRVATERQQSVNPKDIPRMQLPSNLKVKPSSSVKIHFNPLTDKNKLSSVPGKGIVGKISSTDSSKSKQPMMRTAASSSMKENTLPSQSKFLVSRSLSKNGEVKMTPVPTYLARKPVDGNIRRFKGALYKTAIPQ